MFVSQSSVVNHALVGTLQLSAPGSETRTNTRESARRPSTGNMTGDVTLLRELAFLKSSSVDHWTSTTAAEALTLRAEAFRRAITGRGRASPMTLAVSLVYVPSLPTWSISVT